MDGLVEGCPRIDDLRRDLMRTPDEAAAMVRLKGLGWGVRRIAAEFGCSRETVRRYVKAGGFVEYRSPRRAKALDGREDFLAERFRRHRGNADVVRQDLARELGVAVSLRTVERAVAGFRQALQAEARACVRFETPPGRQLQIDFGETRVSIGGESVRVYLFVATLGYSRRIFVQVFRHERQSAWFDGLEAAFAHIGGVPQEALMDNARALVDEHDAVTREVRFNARLLAFARYWGFRPRACAPYRARTKGKDERGVGYVKRNAIAGHRFESWAALEAHLFRGGCARSPTYGTTARHAGPLQDISHLSQRSQIRGLAQRPNERRRRKWREGGSVRGMAYYWRCSGHRTGIPYPLPACGSALRGSAPARSHSTSGTSAGSRTPGSVPGQGAIPAPTGTVRLMSRRDFQILHLCRLSHVKRNPV